MVPSPRTMTSFGELSGNPPQLSMTTLLVPVRGFTREIAADSAALPCGARR